MTGTTEKKPTWTTPRATVIAVVVCVVELVLIFAFGPEPMRFSLLTGLLAGALAGFGGLAFVSRMLDGGINAMLKAVVFGFMLRAVLVAVGLVIVMRTPDSEPLAFVGTFFPLFFVFATLEALVASAHANVHRTPAS